MASYLHSDPFERLVAACEARITIPYDPPKAPAEREKWDAVIVEHVNATEAARRWLNGREKPRSREANA